MIHHSISTKQTIQGYSLWMKITKTWLGWLSAVLFIIVNIFVNWFTFYTFLVMLTILCFNLHTHTHISFTKFTVCVCLGIYPPDDDLAEVETCGRNVSDKLLFITDCAVCWINCCIINLLYGIWITFFLYCYVP